MTQNYVFTSESVSEGHPDKIADQISDAILDAIITKDPMARVACETLVKTGMVLVAGEITTSAWVDIESITRELICKIGYTSSTMGFDGKSCAIINAIGKQSPDIAMGVDNKEMGAGDQGLMFGYASNESESFLPGSFMPAPIMLAHLLTKQQAHVRKSGSLSWLRPDAKSQVTLRYENGKPIEIDTIVLSTQHAPEVSHATITEAVIEEIIKPVLPKNWVTKNTRYLVNPTGRFVIGGPVGDCGLTGRKIIVDSYGGMARHGGGCFSGKDATKVDRSGAYMARYAAKNIVAAGLADRCEIQISYAIGVAEPTSINIETFGTGKISDEKLIALLKQYFDFRPRAIIEALDLRKPIYLPTATYGHFGRTDIALPWEKTDKATHLK